MGDCDGSDVGSATNEVIEVQDKNGKIIIAILDRTEGKLVYLQPNKLQPNKKEG